jgi:hypothetical protein
MKNIFNRADGNEILARIDKLTPESKVLWGSMNVSQMMAHAAAAAKMPTGELTAKRVGFPVGLIGTLLKSKILKSPNFRKNAPTAPELKVTDVRDFEKEKTNFKTAVKKLVDSGESIAKASHHPFFGKMSPNEWGRINYIHADHHLSQFGV